MLDKIKMLLIYIVILFIFLISIGAICATDLNDKVLEYSDEPQLNTTDVKFDDSSEVNILEENSKNGPSSETLTSSKEDDILLANSYNTASTFNELSECVMYNKDGTIKLTSDYYLNEKYGIKIQKNLIITTNGTMVTIDGNHKAYNLFSIYNNRTVTLKNIHLINSNSSAIHINGNLTCINCIFENNYDSIQGGAIDNVGNLTCINCSFINNNAKQGGAIINHRNVTCNNCTFISNNANYGGAIDNTGNFICENCSFLNNTALNASYGYGGAMSNSMNLTCINCTFINNQVCKYGGAISNSKNLQCYNCTFTNNKANEGQAVDYRHGEITLLNDCVYNNNNVYPNSEDEVSVPKTTTTTAAVTAKKVTVKAPAVKFKKGAKKYFKITLKYKNKALKNFKFKIKVYTDGAYKTYTLKTNKKGVAKFNTKKLLYGTHKIVIYSINSNYKISKTSKVKITQKRMHKASIKFNYDNDIDQFNGHKSIGKKDIIWVNFCPGYSPQAGISDGVHVYGSGKNGLKCSYHKIIKVVVQYKNYYNGKVIIKNYKPNKQGSVSKVAPTNCNPTKAIVYYKS